jgi:pRiA4b ORF-3-like protein
VENPFKRGIKTYDFNDHWQHLIRIEAILQSEPDRFYPFRISGKRAAPHYIENNQQWIPNYGERARRAHQHLSNRRRIKY